LFEQLTACSAALQAYAEAHGALPSEREMQGILDYDLAWERRRPGPEQRRGEIEEMFGPGSADEPSEREAAMRMIRRGALQMVASMLLQQIPQKSKGEWDIYTGVRLIHEANAKARSHRLEKKDLAAVLEQLKKRPKRKT
jgi:hypothetical protein